MATVEECRAALHQLAGRMKAHAGEVRDKVDLDRTLACRLTDIDAAFHARLRDGQLVDITDGNDPAAKIALRIGSDDLLALVDGRLDFGRAFASRRLSVSANPFDLLKLRKLI